MCFLVRCLEDKSCWGFENVVYPELLGPDNNSTGGSSDSGESSSVLSSIASDHSPGGDSSGESEGSPPPERQYLEAKRSQLRRRTE